MPIYVYKNLETGKTFEVQQSIKDDALKEDPETGAPVHRVIQPVGIAFKGSGFYINDSKNTKSTSTPPATSSDSNSEAKADGNSESKTASSADKGSTAKSETKAASSSSSDSGSKSGSKSAAKSSKSTSAPKKS